MDSHLFEILVAMLIISGISMAAIGLYARRFVDRVPAATPFILLMFCAAGWSILYALDLLTPALGPRVIYHNLRFLFIPFFSVLELWLVLEYVNRRDWIRRDYAIAVLIIPVIAAILSLTSPYHTLFRYNFSINMTTPVPVLHFTESLFFQVYFLYSFVLLALAILLLIVESRKQGTLWEMPTILLLIALAFPTVVNYITQVYQIPFPGINPTPALLWIAAILYLVALFRYRFLDIIPIARGRLIEALSKPVLVLDTSGRVIDINPAACSLFGLSPAAALGRTIDEIASDWPDFLSLCRERTTMKRDLVRTRGGETFIYIGSVEPLLDISGVPEGHLVFLQDVTDLRRAQDALKEKTAEMDQYFSTSLDLFCIADTLGYFRRLNPQWEKTLGYPLTELEGRRFLDFVHPDDLQGTLDAISDLSTQKEVLNFTNRYRHRDGTYRWIEWRSFPKGDRIFAAARDITQRKQIEVALRESEDRFSRAIAGTGAGLWDWDMVSGRVYFSPQWKAMLGYEEDEIENAFEGWKNLWHPDDVARIEKAVNDYLNGKTTKYEIEHRLRHKDGSWHWILTRGDIQRDAAGRPIRWAGTNIDITDRKGAEEALRESEEKYRMIIEEMQDLFYRTDIHGKITMLSPSAFTLSGYPPDELIGQDVTIVYADKKDREMLLAVLKEKGSVDAFPLRLKTRDGSIRYVTTSSHLYRDANGDIRGVEGVIHDMTEQRRAEEALRIANKKLNLLSSITRHDIRNQLMALMAFLELSMDSLDKPEEVQEFLKKNQKIATTISDQITFTKAYEDMGVMAPGWQNVRQTIENAASGLPVRNARITINTGDLEIFADPLVEKVFYNLIDNSLRYGGETMNTIRVTSHPSGQELIVVFEDNGPGILDRDKQVIFDKGYGKNTGLGLYLTREILAITGITIRETGEPGKGARFEMTIPEGGFRLAGTP